MNTQRENMHRELWWLVAGVLWSWILLSVCVAGYSWRTTLLPTVQFAQAEVALEAPARDARPMSLHSVIQVLPPVPKTTQVSIEVEPPTTAWLSAGDGKPLHKMRLALKPGKEQFVLDLQVRPPAEANAHQQAVLRLVTPEGIRVGDTVCQTIRVHSFAARLVPDEPLPHPKERHSLTITLALVGGKRVLCEGPTEDHVTVQAKASATVPEDVVIPFHIGGTAQVESDFTLQPSTALAPGAATGTLVIEAGYDKAELLLSQRDDEEGNEGEEAIDISFSPPNLGGFAAGSPTRFTVTIRDDDLPPITLAWEADKRVLDEGVSQDAAALIARIDAPATQDIAVEYQLSGSAIVERDFNVSSPQLVIPQGQREGRLVLTVVDNATYQGPREAKIAFPRRAGKSFRGDTAFQLSIEDDEPPTVKLELAKSRLDERVPGDVATLAAILPAPATETVTLPLTLSGTASDKIDFDLSSATLIIPAGEHRGQVSFSVRNDNFLEGTEVIEIRVSAATVLAVNSPTDFRIEVLDDEIIGHALVLLLGTSYFGRRIPEFQGRLEALTSDAARRERLIGHGVVVVLAPQNGRPRAKSWLLDKDEPALEISKESQIRADSPLEDVFNAAFSLLAEIKSRREKSGYKQPFLVFLLWPETRDPTELAIGGAGTKLQTPAIGSQELYTCLVDHEGSSSRWLEDNFGKHGRAGWDAVRYFRTGDSKTIAQLINEFLDTVVQPEPSRHD